MSAKKTEQTPPADPPEPPKPMPPPAAKIVLEGDQTEKVAALEKKLKSRETRIAELEDENRRLKTPEPPEQTPTPTPTPSPTAKPKRKSVLDGWPFYG